MQVRPPRATSVAFGRSMALLACAGAGLVLAYLVGVDGQHAKSVLSDTSLALVLGAAGSVVLRASAGRSRDPRRPLGFLLVFGALLHLALLVHLLVWPASIPFGGASYADAVFLVPGALILLTLRDEFARHLAREERREVVADIVLVWAAVGGIVFLVLQPEGTRTVSGADLSSVVFALAVLAPVAWGALAVWA